MKAIVSGMVRNPSGSSPSYRYPGSRLSQLGVSSRSESHRSVFQEFATSPRSRTTWSIERAVRQWLMARPAWPAPMTTVVTRMGSLRSADFDRHVRRVRDHVVDGGAFLRLGHDGADLLGTRVGLDVIRHLDPVEAVANVAVDAEDPLDVHAAFQRRRHRVQLDVAILRDGCDARGQATRQPAEHHLDRGGSVVFGGEDLRVIGVERELRAVPLLLAEPEEALDRGAAVRSPQPLTLRAPLELGAGRGLGQCRSGSEQRVHIDTIVDALLGARAAL